MPVTSPEAKKMCDLYFNDWKKCWNIVERIRDEPEFGSLKNDPDFASFYKILNPETQTVSGVFGKEIILQILAQRHCEGIRYVVGTAPGGKNTIIILGVNHATDAQGRDLYVTKNGEQCAQSKPLERNTNITVDAGVIPDPVNGEVHRHSLTMEQAREIFPTKFVEGNISDAVFGIY